jgi:Arc/MetJ-type ribon-helix-helix transcriptional regulator
MINTINISLPSELKKEADSLVSNGHFVSFSDLVRTALRKLLSESKYDMWANEAKKEFEKGETEVLKNKTQIQDYVKSLASK